MGMTIDKTLEYLTDFDLYSPYQEAINKVSAYIEQMQADYEARLKADMVAMLTELQVQFEKYEPKWAENEDQVIASNRTWDDFDDLIQKKIDKLKENKNGNDEQG